MKEYTIVKRTVESNPDWALTVNKLYAVETNEDWVDVELFEIDGTITVWNDDGHLAEMYEGEYEVVTVDRIEWLKVRPREIYLEMC